MAQAVWRRSAAEAPSNSHSSVPRRAPHSWLLAYLPFVATNGCVRSKLSSSELMWRLEADPAFLLAFGHIYDLDNKLH